MTPHVRIIRQLEVGAGCLLVGYGLAMCMQSHWAKSTHIGEFGTREPAPWVIDAPWWVIDGIWLFGLLVAAVIGFRGGFLGSRLTAIAAFLMIVATVATTGIPFTPMAFFVLGAFHLLAVLFVGLRLYLRRSNPENANEMTNANSN